MLRRKLAALLVLAACGCTQAPPADTGPAADATTPDVEVSIPEATADQTSGQTENADADSNLTRVSLNVRGMT